LFNLLLRLNKFGRLALTDEQRRASSWFAAVVIPPCCPSPFVFILDLGASSFWARWFLDSLMIPVFGSFKASEGCRARCSFVARWHWPRPDLRRWECWPSELHKARAGPERNGSIGERHCSVCLSWGGVIFMWGANAIIPIRPKR
jgi:hypothetical protein